MRAPPTSSPERWPLLGRVWRPCPTPPKYTTTFRDLKHIPRYPLVQHYTSYPDILHYLLTACKLRAWTAAQTFFFLGTLRSNNHHGVGQGLEVKVWRAYDDFVEELSERFPHERVGIKKFYGECWAVFNALNSLELKSLEEPRYLLGGITLQSCYLWCMQHQPCSLHGMCNECMQHSINSPVPS